MKKKILCLALCLFMIVASFVGCAEKSRDELMNQIGRDASVGAVTLSMYILAEDKVSVEQERLIEDAVNDIVSSYKIKLDLRYFTEDTYYKTLEKHLKEHKAYNKDKDRVKETVVPIYTDDNGLPTTYYPPIEDFQVDLFYFSGYERYKKYSSEEYLADFTTELISSASLLKGGISSILYENVKTLNGQYDMMPVNAEVGEYTYMLLNKKLSGTQFKAEDLVSPVSEKCAELLEMIKEYYPDYVPLYSSEGVLSLDDVKFFGVDKNGFATDDFSIIAGTYDSSWNYGEANAYPAFNALNATENNGSGTAVEQIKTLKNYEFNGYYATEADADKPFAVGYIKGGLDVIEKYGDEYEIVVVDTPTLTTEAFYENVMAISAETKSLSASARILAELYTNKELINILANGIEGENYIWTKADGEDGQSRVIEKQAKDDRYIYNIDPYKMANVAAIYPTVDDDPARSERILDQNSDAKKDLLLGYTLYGTGVKLDPMLKIAEYSKTAYDKIVAAKDNAELDAAFAEIETMIASDEVQAVLGSGDVATYYMKWLTAKGIYVAPTEEA